MHKHLSVKNSSNYLLFCFVVLEEFLNVRVGEGAWDDEGWEWEDRLRNVLKCMQINVQQLSNDFPWKEVYSPMVTSIYGGLTVLDTVRDKKFKTCFAFRYAV